MIRNIWDGIINGWRVWVTQWPDAVVVTATCWEPAWMIHQTEMGSFSDLGVRHWVNGLRRGK